MYLKIGDKISAITVQGNHVTGNVKVILKIPLFWIVN